MFGLSARDVAYYAAFAYPIALFCAIPYFSDYVALDETDERRRLRTARLLVLLAPVHVLFPLTALGIVHDATRLAKSRDANATARQQTRALAGAGLAISIAALVAFANAT